MAPEESKLRLSTVVDKKNSVDTLQTVNTAVITMDVAEINKNSNNTMAKVVGVAANGGSNQKTSGGSGEITTRTKILGGSSNKI